MLMVTPHFKIALSEIEFTYARSSGPGGQNVNKVNSKAVLRWDLLQSPSVPEPLRSRLLLVLGEQLTREGELVLSSDRFRDQPRNREDCLEKLRELLARAAVPPLKRKKTKPTRSSKRRTREAKGHKSEIKKMRSNRWGED